MSVRLKPRTVQSFCERSYMSGPVSLEDSLACVKIGRLVFVGLLASLCMFVVCLLCYVCYYF